MDCPSPFTEKVGPYWGKNWFCLPYLLGKLFHWPLLGLDSTQQCNFYLIDPSKRYFGHRHLQYQMCFHLQQFQDDFKLHLMSSAKDMSVQAKRRHWIQTCSSQANSQTYHSLEVYSSLSPSGQALSGQMHHLPYLLGIYLPSLKWLLILTSVFALWTFR